MNTSFFKNDITLRRSNFGLLFNLVFALVNLFFSFVFFMATITFFSLLSAIFTFFTVIWAIAFIRGTVMFFKQPTKVKILVGQQKVVIGNSRVVIDYDKAFVSPNKNSVFGVSSPLFPLVLIPQPLGCYEFNFYANNKRYTLYYFSDKNFLRLLRAKREINID